jgi:hypothetical protein
MKTRDERGIAFIATKEKRRTRLDSYSKEMWAGGAHVTLKSVPF